MHSCQRQTRGHARSSYSHHLDGIRELGGCSGDLRGLGGLEYGSDGASQVLACARCWPSATWFLRCLSGSRQHHDRQNVTHQSEIRPLGSRRPSRVGLLVWWVGIAVVVSLIAAALVDVVYSRVVYLFAVMPIAGVLLFPVAWAANRWLTPLISSRIGRSRSS